MSNNLIFDNALKQKQRQRFAKHYSEHNHIFHNTADEILDIISNELKPDFKSALEVGSRDCYLSKEILNFFPDSEIYVTESSQYFLKENTTFPSYIMENEYLHQIDREFDLIINNLNLHWVNDLQKIILQTSSLLNEGGLFVGTMLGGKTLQELRQAILSAEMENGISPRISPFTLTKDAGRLLQFAGFKEPLSSSYEIKVKYNNAFELMDDLQKMGEGNALIQRRKTFTDKTTLHRIAEEYHKQFADNQGKIMATFEIITMIGWK